MADQKMKHEMTREKVAAKMHALKAMSVQSTHIDLFDDQFDRLLARRRAEIAAGNRDEAQGLVVLGSSGSGKTYAVEHVVAKYLADGRLAENEIRSYITPSPATLKQIGWELLAELDYEVQSSRSAAGVLWYRLKNQLRLHKTLFLVIDEAHDLMGRQSRKEAQAVINTLKSLMQQKDWPVSLILVGVATFADDAGLGDLLGHDLQLARRVNVMECEQLDAAVHVEIIADLILEYAQLAGVETSAGMAVTELAQRLMHSVDYAFGNCIKLTIAALGIAMERGERLGADHFAVAYTSWTNARAEQNPFWSSSWHQEAPLLTGRFSKLGRR